MAAAKKKAIKKAAGSKKASGKQGASRTALSKGGAALGMKKRRGYKGARSGH